MESIRVSVRSLMRSGSLKHRLIKGGSWVVIGKAGTILTGFVTNALLTRVLSPDDVGTYFLALSIVTTLSLVAQMGLGRTVILLVGEARGQKHPQKERASITMVLKIGIGGTLLTLLSYLAFGSKITSFFDVAQMQSLTPLIALLILPFALGDLLSDIFRSLQDFKLAELIGGKGVLRGLLLSISLFLLWVSFGNTNLRFAIQITFFAGLFTVLLALLLLWRKIVSMQIVPNSSISVSFATVLSMSWVVLIASLIPAVSNQGALWILAAKRSASEVAILGSVMKFVVVISTPTLFYRQMMAPFIAELYAQNRGQTIERMLRGMANITFLIAILMAIFLVFWGKDALGLVYGEYYEAGALVLIILVIGQLITIATGPCGQLLLMTGNQNYQLGMVALGGVTAVFVSLLLVGPLGYVGAAIGQISFIIVANISQAYMGYHLTGIRSWIGIRKKIA